MDINRTTPVIAAVETSINAPIETVWQILTDFGRWPSWNTTVSRLRIDGPVAPGTTFVWTAGSRITSRIEEVEAPTRIVWSGRTLGIRAVHVWVLRSVDNTTHVRTEESFEGLLAKLLPGLLRRMLAQSLAQGLTALKAEAEKRHR